MSNALAASISRWLQPFVSADVFDFWAQQLNTTVAWNRTLAKVVERRVEAKDSVTLVLKHNRRFQGFQPGQHVNVTVDVDGCRLTRSYSITNVPGVDRRIAITVKRIAGGKVSTHLCNSAKKGDVVELGAAFGDLTLSVGAQEPWLFLAAGSGITPLMSLTRALAQSGMKQPVTLLYWVRSRSEICFVQELKALAAREPNFQVHFFLTRQLDLLPGEQSGRPDLVAINTLVPNLAQRRVYACGPIGFVRSVEELVKPVSQSFNAESFSPLQIDESLEGEVSVELVASGRTVMVPKGQPLLHALEAQGINPTHGCRMGICKTCVCIKTAGTTQDLLTGVQDSEASDALRICISSARSDLKLEL